MRSHTTYSRNNTHKKCGDNSGLWVLNETIKKNPENLKKKRGSRLGVTC